MTLVSFQNADLGYEGKAVIRNVSFSVHAGSYLCIVGENGSGKSTIMKTVLGLLSPVGGNIEFGGGLKQSEIGYLPQQTEVQKDFPASVTEVVISGCLNRCGLRPFFNSAEKKLARDNMERLGIADLSKRCYRELSGGQQQRVLLARALCATKKMLLLDEPVTGLDPKATAELYTTIMQLNSESQITIIMISHDIAAAAKYASHILHIAKTPLFYGSKKEYLQSNVWRQYAGQNQGGVQ